MNSDAAFRIGSSHQVCQDYARAGRLTTGHDISYAIISDGCSGSKDTDIGARFLVLAAEFIIRSEAWLSLLTPSILARRAKGFTESTSSGMLLNESLDATLGLVYVAKNGEKTDAHAFLFGDGVIVAKFHNRVKIVEITYKSGYPDYPSYSLDASRLRAVQSKLTMDVMENTLVLGGVSEVSYEGTAPYHYCETGSDLEYLAVMSDGITSFSEQVETDTSKTDKPVPLNVVLDELLAFKSFTGIFAQRRMQKFEKDCKVQKWSHHDDISIGVVHCG